MATAGDKMRRDEALKVMGAVGLTCAFPFSADELYGQTEAHQHAVLTQIKAAPAPAAGAPKFFGPAEWKLVSRLADLIIPQTDTPGAVAAGVPTYIDFVVSQNKGQQNAFRRGAAWLDAAAQKAHGKVFVELGEAQQIALLTPLCEADDAGRAESDGEKFFGMMKKLTADGYFTSQAGLMQTLGYKGNEAMGEFPGCTHEH